MSLKKYICNTWHQQCYFKTTVTCSNSQRSLALFEWPIILLSSYLLIICLITRTPLTEGAPAYWQPKNFTVTFVEIVDNSNSKSKRSVQEVIETDEDSKPLMMVNEANKMLIVGMYPNQITAARFDPHKYGKLLIVIY